jgi:hypothetical protein
MLTRQPQRNEGGVGGICSDKTHFVLDLSKANFMLAGGIFAYK